MQSILRFPVAILIVLIVSRCEAQYAEITIEHDWAVTMGERQIGLIEVRVEPYNTRYTIVNGGWFNFRTSLRAWTLVTIAAGTVVAGGFAVKAFGKRGGEPTKAT